MKIRQGFVSNSSSTAFVIINKTDEDKSLLDFVKETLYLVKEFVDEYHYGDDEMFTEEGMIESARARITQSNGWAQQGYHHRPDALFEPGENEVMFGDEDGDTVGHVYDYMLRDGGETKNFKWRFLKYCR